MAKTGPECHRMSVVFPFILTKASFKSSPAVDKILVGHMFQ